MPGQTLAFKRLVLGLQAGPSARAIKAAAESASLLNLELVGLFFEDTRLEKLSGIPFARQRHCHDRSARKPCGICDTAVPIAHGSRPSVGPCRDACSCIGPVIAIAAISYDTCINTAAEIAIAAKEELVILYNDSDDESAAAVHQLEGGPPLQIRSIRGSENLLSSLASLSSLLDQLKGRLLVFTRGVAPLEGLLKSGVFRGISVLAVEPPDTMPEEACSPS